MRLLSQVFQPLITIPKNAKIKSTEITCKSQKVPTLLIAGKRIQISRRLTETALETVLQSLAYECCPEVDELLMECGLIRPTSSGLFAILPLARRALDKLETHIRSHLEAAGAQRVSLPALTSASLWKATGRLDDIGPELMRVKDRHDKQYLLAPTHEEAIADLLADVGPISYKQLPLLLYQTTNKYRDEHRPKHGLLRAREFTMLDAYGVHAGDDCALATYRRVSHAYRSLFRRLGLTVHRVSAPTGDMGGYMSHEWQLAAAAGEDELSVCESNCGHAGLGRESLCGKCGGAMSTVSSIEVGHTFLLGSKYSAPLAAHFTPAAGPPLPLYMSCYGIGVTRLMAACVDVLADDNAVRWPRGIAPYTAIVIGPKEGSKEWHEHGWSDILNVQARLSNVPGLQDDVLIDDRHGLTIGKRLMQADRLGYPFIIVCGRAALETPPRYELHVSSQGKTTPQLLTLSEIAAALDRIMRDDVISDVCDDLVMDRNKG